VSERNDAVIRFYDGLLAEKSGSEILGFSSNASQHVRFSTLIGIGDLEGRSVLDVGCGAGDLFTYLREAVGEIDYRGVDIHAGLIDYASGRYPEGRFEVRDVLAYDATDEVDYVLSSGVFGLAPNGDPDFIRAMLTRQFALARIGVSVNFLSARTPNPMDERSHYADPTEILELAFTLTRNVVLRHDYKANDFTLYLRHEPPGDS